MFLKTSAPGRFTIALAVAALVADRSFAGQDEGDIFPARTSAGQLTFTGFDPANEIVLLPYSEFFNVWSLDEPGFDALGMDVPEEDLYTLESGVQVRIEAVSLDPAFYAASDKGIIEQPGDRLILGGANLHIHLNWIVSGNDPGFDPLKVLWRATFKLVDTGSTGYADSEPFTFHFAIVDCTRGDCDESGTIDAGDIQKFVDTVLDPVSATAEDRCRADTDRDGYATPDDAESFVELLLTA